MLHGARQAKDSELIQYATEIKVRAERRAGEMTGQMETAQGRRTSSHDEKKSKAEQLADVGLTVQEAHRYEALAAMPAEHFETAVATAKAGNLNQHTQRVSNDATRTLADMGLLPSWTQASRRQITGGKTGER